MKAVSIIMALCFPFFCCISCKSDDKRKEVTGGTESASTSPVHQLLKSAFSAIADNNYNHYSRLTTTSADIIISRMDLSPAKANQSYVGSSLRTQERKRHKSRFKLAVKGGKNQIDFKNSKYIGIGEPVDSGRKKLLSHGSYNYKTYSLMIETDGEILTTNKLAPQFVVVEFKGQKKIIGLVFP